MNGRNELPRREFSLCNLRFFRISCRRGRRSIALALALGVLVSTMPTANAQDGVERPEYITAKAEYAIKKGLAFLAKNQSRDGSWRSRGGYGGGYPTAMTSLAGLALLAGGNTPVEGEHSRQVRRAVDYILSNSDRNTGLIARINEERSCMHGHGFAMLFLAEAYGMERDEKRQKIIRSVLERSIKLTQSSQSRLGGWLYTPDSGSDEGSVTVTQIQGLRACRNAGISVPKKVIDEACNYIKRSAQSDGGISYRVGMGGSRPAITAAAVAVMYNAGEYENEVALKALAYTKKLLKGNRSQPYGGHKFYGMLYASQAMYLSTVKEDKNNRDNWKTYFIPVRDDLVRTQSAAGSWGGDGVGDVYGTAIACLVLQLPYANLPILQR